MSQYLASFNHRRRDLLKLFERADLLWSFVFSLAGLIDGRCREGRSSMSQDLERDISSSSKKICPFLSAKPSAEIMFAVIFNNIWIILSFQKVSITMSSIFLYICHCFFFSVPCFHSFAKEVDYSCCKSSSSRLSLFCEIWNCNMDFWFVALHHSIKKCQSQKQWTT